MSASRRGLLLWISVTFVLYLWQMGSALWHEHGLHAAHWLRAAVGGGA